MTAILVTDKSGCEARFACDPGERILHAGLRAGAALPYDCGTGTCGACRAAIVDGAVDHLWADAPGAKRIKSDAEGLMCQMAPRADCALKIRTPFSSLTPGRAPVYRAGELHLIERLTDEVGVFRLHLDEAAPFMAGQFGIVWFDGLDGARAYSMTRYDPDALEHDFLIRAFPGGGASALLFDDDFASARVRVFGPLGKAVFDPEEGRPFIAIAGGSGVAGMLAILDHAARARHFAAHPSALYFGLRGPDSAYLLDDLNARAAEDGLSVSIVFSDSRADAALRARCPNLAFVDGMVHAVAAEALQAQPPGPETLFYVAGPPPMVDAAMRSLVMQLKISPTEIRYDKFG
ncbi:MAG: 2Fe-2S iron-sulfur cluster binding domain-containing protein [Pseudomonadota bacterium]